MAIPVAGNDTGGSDNQPASQSALKILIADDNQSDRMILKAIVTSQGHQVVIAVDGLDAVSQYAREKPDLVLLDALMPKMDGFEAARQIKQMALDELIPIIFLTSLNDAESLARCLGAGGDDFLPKPYNPIILRAKINAFDRMRKMHKTLRKQRDQIAESNQHLLREQQVAKSVFDNVAHMGCLGAANIRHLISPLSIFNGDVLLACQKPSGDMHILLGDFTGHGLAAAIGAMPLAELFYGMTSRGYSLRNIIIEINDKLKNILPLGFFCCACLAELKFELNEVEIWMGGLPDGFLLQADKLTRVKSNHLPLGILAAECFDASSYRYEMNAGDRLYVWSDGIIESADSNGDFYGDQRLERLVTQYIHCPDLFDRIKHDVLLFAGSSDPTDDLTMLELSMPAEADSGITVNDNIIASGQGPGSWQLEYCLQDDSLAKFDPVPLLLQMAVEVPGLRCYSGQVFTIISELYANALDHGVLGLDSKLKSSPDGFAKYYQLRDQRCRELSRELKTAYIAVRIIHNGDSTGGVLTLRVEDSGAGFDYDKKLAPLADPGAVTSSQSGSYSGRGLNLLSKLCSRMAYLGKGNIVEVDYTWSR